MLETLESVCLIPPVLSHLIQSFIRSYLYIILFCMILRTCCFSPYPQMPTHPLHLHLLLDYHHSLLTSFLIFSLTSLHFIFHVFTREIFKIHPAQVSEDNIHLQTHLSSILKNFQPSFLQILLLLIPSILSTRNLNTHI